MEPSVFSTHLTPSCIVEHDLAKWSPWGPDSGKGDLMLTQ